ncbi:MAG TPA: prepilin peptidase [Armatimonadota bacterium]|jgi:leader peptidase (prepilin peptidase)/N-methyltransferase
MNTAQLMIGAVTAFLYGIVVGSFLNVCIYRLPQGESLSSPPSHCPKCQTRLRPRDLVPLFSFLALRGKCRYCGVSISWRYFTIEFITGLLFTAFWLALAWQFPDRLATAPFLFIVVMACIFAAAMLVTFMIDLDTTYVIEPVTWVAMAAGLCFELGSKWLRIEPVAFTIGGLTIPYLPAAVPGMALGFLVFVLMDLFGRLIFRKPSMGLGDAYIGAAIGAMLGPQLALLSFGIAIIFGAVIGVALMIAGTLQRRTAPGAEEGKSPEDIEELPQGTYMPFGPFLTASAVLVALAPVWVSTHLAQLWHWWIYQNPFVS